MLPRFIKYRMYRFMSDGISPLIKLRKKGRGIVIASTVMMLLLFPYSLYGLCLMGLADRLMGIRRRVGKSK